MAALAVVSASDVSSDDAVAIHVYGEEWRIAVPAEWRADVLCSRHTALLHTDSVAPLPEQAHADGLSPTVWPAGTLRREPDRACPVCSVLSNWDRIRIAGLQRASGAALLLDDVAARLREALTARSTALCLRHWRAATTAPPEVAHTLINWQLRSVNTLYAAFLHRPDGDTAILPPARVRREGLPANADVAAHLFLAGYPA